MTLRRTLVIGRQTILSYGKPPMSSTALQIGHARCKSKYAHPHGTSQRGYVFSVPLIPYVFSIWHGPKACAKRSGAAASVAHRQSEQGEACELAGVTRERQAWPLSACIRTRAYGENIWYQRYADVGMHMHKGLLSSCRIHTFSFWFAASKSFSSWLSFSTCAARSTVVAS